MRDDEAELEARVAERTRQLAASEARYRALVEQAGDIIYRVDLSGRFTFANAAALRAVGRQEDEVLGQRFTVLVHPSHRDEVEAFYLRQFEGRIPSTYHEFLALTAGGGSVWLGQNVQLLSDPEHGDTFQAIARDITLRKQAEVIEADLELQATVVKNLREGVCLVRMDKGTIVYANPKFEEMFGYGPGEMSGVFGNDLNYEDGAGLAERRAAEILTEVTASGTAEYEVENVRRDGSRFSWSRPRVADHAPGLRPGGRGHPGGRLGEAGQRGSAPRKRAPLRAPGRRHAPDRLDGALPTAGPNIQPALVRLLGLTSKRPRAGVGHPGSTPTTAAGGRRLDQGPRDRRHATRWNSASSAPPTAPTAGTLVRGRAHARAGRRVGAGSGPARTSRTRRRPDEAAEGRPAGPRASSWPT